jgi:ureidoacrylate peracid hydrolase
LADDACSGSWVRSTRAFDIVLITGTVTNVCCKSSARDAMMTNFKTVL